MEWSPDERHLVLGTLALGFSLAREGPYVKVTTDSLRPVAQVPAAEPSQEADLVAESLHQLGMKRR
jgi:hypothetical protein